MKKITSNRDISVFGINTHNYLTFAIDSIGGIGNKNNDILTLSPKEAARYTTRVCLNETFSVGATVQAIFVTICNEFYNTGEEILQGIKEELKANTIKPLEINFSTEENFQTTMTAFGITLMGNTSTLKWRDTKPGYNLYLYSNPFNGKEVLKHSHKLLTPSKINQLFERYRIGDLIPCGSRGIKHEIEVLKKENNIEIEISLPQNSSLNMQKSAGPATCGIFTSPDKITEINITQIGYVI